MTIDSNDNRPSPSSEKIVSLSVGGGFAGTAAVNVNAGVSVIGITTTAYIGDGATVAATGSVRVGANESLKLDLIAGNISAAGSAAVGAAISVPVVIKETHAYIGDNAKVSGAGGGALTVKNGTFTVVPLDTRFNPRTAVNAGTDTIDLGYAHGYSAGQRVLYDNAGATDIPGLTDGGTYYVIPAGGTSVKLADSY